LFLNSATHNSRTKHKKQVKNTETANKLIIREKRSEISGFLTKNSVKSLKTLQMLTVLYTLETGSKT